MIDPEINKIHLQNCLSGLPKLPDECINTCVTSPPYWGLRDYGVEGQLGLEDTPEEFIEKMVQVFREVKRVLRKDGTLWINIGDSYASGPKFRSAKQATEKSTLSGSPHTQILKQQNKIVGDLKPKDLVGIPWMLAFALRKDGWYLRQDIIWHKPNCMPESVSDRCTKNHEYLFLLSKSRDYYYDQDSILKDASPNTHARVSQNVLKQKGSERANGGTRPGRPMKTVMRKPRPDIDTRGGNQGAGDIPFARKMESEGSGNRNNPSFNRALIEVVPKVNKRSVWTIPNVPFKESHFATFPENLIVDCIKAGCPEYGIVMDPFMGAGTTAVVARKLNRNYIGFEINRNYKVIADNRIQRELGLFAKTERRIS